MQRGDCGCRNHFGNRKIKYPSRDDALDALLRKHLRFGPHQMYECPNMSGVWHITSVV